MNGMSRCTIGLLCDREWEPTSPSDTILHSARALLEAGALPRLIYLGGGEAAEQLDRVCALLMPGGYDLDPYLYGQPRDGGARLEKLDPEFDRFQLEVARQALERALPILGICRGAQILNVAAGGDLQQSLPQAPDHQQDRPAPEPSHEVVVASGSRLAQALDPGPGKVNSKHHQAVADLAEGFKITARAPDGTIEAFERIDGPWQVGCEFHPETLRLTQAPLQELFQQLVHQAEAWAEKRGFSR